jgi:16S rRNA (guanine966-N2)-methyltransferase
VSPAGLATRPTSDRVREAVFSMLFSLGDVQGLAVLDLFAGSGALGIEALSRGAATATFVDADVAAVRSIEQNLATCGLAERASVRRDDAARFLAACDEHFDVVFADPPYAFDGWDRLLAALVGVVPAGTAVLESDRELDVGQGWLAVRSRRYGSTVVTIARPAPQEHQ